MKTGKVSEELILKVGGEGGLLAIWSLSTGGTSERFTIRRNETALGDLISEEDAAGTSISEELGTVPTFDEALRTLGRYPWQRLYPVHVHPKFVEAVLREVKKLRGEAQVERWKHLVRRECG